MINNIIDFLTTAENLILIVIPAILIIIIEYMNINALFILGSTIHFPAKGAYNLKFKHNGQILAILIFYLEMNLFVIDTWWKIVLALIIPFIHLIPSIMPVSIWPGLYIRTNTNVKVANNKEFEKWYESEKKLQKLSDEYYECYERAKKIFKGKYLMKEVFDKSQDLNELKNFIKRPTSEEEDKCIAKMKEYYEVWDSIPWYIKESSGYKFVPQELGLSPRLLSAGMFF